jgi:hypothetical protein
MKFSTVLRRLRTHFTNIFSPMDFKITGPCSMQASTFFISEVGRPYLKYGEADRLLHIDVDDGEILTVYLSSVKMWTIPPDEPLLPNERARIAANLTKGLTFLGIPHNIITSPRR